MSEAEALLAEREKASRLCASCSLRAELWVAFALDLVTAVAILAELPISAPAATGFLPMILMYLCLVVFPSACCFLAALRSLSPLPRRILVRFLYWKIPACIVLHLYFLVGPWATPVCRWMCETNYNNAGALGTGAACEHAIAALQACRGFGYAVYGAFTLRAARAFSACHPANDEKEPGNDE